MPSSLPHLPLLVGGFMGTGKSTVGRAVAARAAVPFVDLDEAVAARAGKSVSEIFRDDGEPAFRALEREELTRVLALGGPRVVALGGGALLDPAVRRDALQRARVVTLVAQPRTILERTAGAHRPLLEGAADRAARVADLLAARATAYAETHASVTTDSVPVEQTVEAVVRAWCERAVVVPLGARSYAVRITEEAAASAADAIAALQPSGVFLVTDETVGKA